MSKLVLPQSTVELIDGAAWNHWHPGLQLDKFSITGDQQAQKAALDKVCKIAGDSALLDSLIERRQRALESLPGAIKLQCETTGPMTLHLSRASALENAGICLHPLYGFTYLPGSGLKGMARAFAETIWLPVQKNQQQAWRQIEDVFGWAPSSDRGKNWKPLGMTNRASDDNARVGAIVFHDAWPTTWPELFVDIVNNHHPDYYQHDDNDHPPGDWENPIPVYFLAVKPGTTFEFPLSKRRNEVLDDQLDLARQWLLGALCHLGAGAKTNAGYGAFKPTTEIDESLPAAVGKSWNAATTGPSPKGAVFETTLELVTPRIPCRCRPVRPRRERRLRPAPGHAPRPPPLVVADHARRLPRCQDAPRARSRHLGRHPRRRCGAHRVVTPQRRCCFALCSCTKCPIWGTIPRVRDG